MRRNMTDPAVTIILVNWNGKTVTLDCLASLRALRYPHFRVMVVDNGSKDDSIPAIRGAFPEVDILALDENRRFAGGNNAGIHKAVDEGADLVLLLNNDTLVDPEMLRHLVDCFRREPACGMVAPKIYYADAPDVIWFAGGELSFWTGTMRHTGIRETDRGQFDRPRDIAYATGCCILISREVIGRVGVLDESFFMYTEDADWSKRVRDAGYRIVYEPRARIWHKLSVSAGGHLSLFKLRNKAISNFRFFARHARWYHWLTFPWLTVLVNTWAAVRYLRVHPMPQASRSPATGETK
jgi:GT2 family glycosyltransferase